MKKEYRVSIPDYPDEKYGPYVLKTAKQFARIGSQHGAPRVVKRGRMIVRVYADGRRIWPTHKDDIKSRAFRKAEIPSSLK